MEFWKLGIASYLHHLFCHGICNVSCSIVLESPVLLSYKTARQDMENRA
jgi:hypothetical protein